MPASANVEILTGPDKGKVVPFKNDKMTFGRHESSDISLDGKKVSRNHATIGVRNGKFVITDLGSKNRTRINGEPITEKFLNNGDEITIGEFLLRFRVRGDEESTMEEAVASMPGSGSGEDDGTQIVDMNALLKSPAGASAKAPTKVAPPAAKSTSPKPVPEIEGIEKTDMIDVNQLLAKSGPVKVPAKTTAPPDTGRNTPQNIKFARTEEGGNIEEGTDLLNMEDILGDENAPKVREVSPIFFAVGGFMIILIVMVFMVVKQMMFATATAQQESKQKVGVNNILHLPVNPDNDFAGADSYRAPEEELIQAEFFLATNDKVTGQRTHHCALSPQFPGEATMVIGYKNGDSLVVKFVIEDSKRPVVPGTREEKILAAQKALKVADEYFSKQQNAAENLRNAYLKYTEVLEILSQVELGSFLTEYESAKVGQDKAKREINGRYNEIEGDFTLAEKRDDRTSAIEVLRKMLEYRLGDNDMNYLKNRTYLEFKYGETVGK